MNRSIAGSQLRAWLLSHIGETFTIAEVIKKSNLAKRSLVGKTLRGMVKTGEVERIGNGTSYVTWRILDAKEPIQNKAEIATALIAEAIWPDLETYVMIEDVRSVDSLP